MTTDEKINAIKKDYPDWHFINGSIRDGRGGMSSSMLFIRRAALRKESYGNIATILMDTEHRTPAGTLYQWKPEVSVWCAVYPGSFEPWIDSALDYFRTHIANASNNHNGTDYAIDV